MHNPGDPLVERFVQSMRIDYEKWHDGTGYDIGAIHAATPVQRATIESILLARGVSDWRDVEALAAIGSEPALTRLRETLAHGDDSELATAVLRHAPQLADSDTRTRTLVDALERAEFYGGLSQALDEVEVFHPQAILSALLRGALDRTGEVAVHFAAMLMYLHGKAESSFDMDQRPFFLRFNTPERAAREAVFRELCVRLGIDPAAYL
ncbi:MAG: hypothetical protein KDG50_08905 [Chromatiales bacterium]|nr:hypothetical protein [Chromatiales bacterium]